MNKNQKIEKEIELLKHKLNWLNFEQNHLLNDWIPRLIISITLALAIFPIAFNLGYYFVASLIFFLISEEIIRYTWGLKKERGKIVRKRIILYIEISKKYEELLNRKN